MGDKNSRAGGKFNGNHTTLSNEACLLVDVGANCPFVYNISPGFLKAGLKSAHGQRSVKIIDLAGKSILLAVRGNASQQEVHVYTRDIHATKLAIARAARNAGLHISFENRP